MQTFTLVHECMRSREAEYKNHTAVSLKHCCLSLKHCCLSLKHCCLSLKHCCLSLKHCCLSFTAEFLFSLLNQSMRTLEKLNTNIILFHSLRLFPFFRCRLSVWCMHACIPCQETEPQNRICMCVECVECPLLRSGSAVVERNHSFHIPRNFLRFSTRMALFL